MSNERAGHITFNDAPDRIAPDGVVHPREFFVVNVSVLNTRPIDVRPSSHMSWRSAA
jgi:hypothetical protein